MRLLPANYNLCDKKLLQFRLARIKQQREININAAQHVEKLSKYFIIAQERNYFKLPLAACMPRTTTK